MPEFVRVHDIDTNTDSSIIASTVHLGNYEVLDEPALNECGDPLPAKRREAHKSLSSRPNPPGQKADPEKENS